MAYSLNINGTNIAVTSHTVSPAVYNITVDVIRLTNTASADGYTEAEAVVVNNMAAHIKWVSGRSKVLFNKDTWLLDAVMRCRIADITVKDRIRYGGNDYEIVDMYDFNNLGTLLVIGLKRIVA